MQGDEPMQSNLAEKHIEDEPVEAAVVRAEELRLLEAMLFASDTPLDEATLKKKLPDGIDIKASLALLQEDYALRGVNLVRINNKWSFRTASDLSWLMTRESTETRRLSRAAIEVLAIIAYHQPVTRAEIEEIRGVVTSKGTLDVLLETGWIRPRGRRKTPGRPLTFGTTEQFLSQFNLEALGDLPGLDELRGTGLLDSRLPGGFSVPTPSDDPQLREDEDPLEPGDDLELALVPRVEPEPAAEPEPQAASEEQAAAGEATVAEVAIIEEASVIEETSAAEDMSVAEEAFAGLELPAEQEQEAAAEMEPEADSVMEAEAEPASDEPESDTGQPDVESSSDSETSSDTEPRQD
jgi:segregation and condensation protein B